MILKKGVNPMSIKPELLLALTICDRVFSNIEIEMVVTSLNDSKHSNNSLHYSGAAADIRTNYFKDHYDKETYVNKIIAALGYSPDYDVILEDDHIHIEWQPKYKEIT